MKQSEDKEGKKTRDDLGRTETSACCSISSNDDSLQCLLNCKERKRRERGKK